MASAPRLLPHLGASPTALVQAHPRPAQPAPARKLKPKFIPTYLNLHIDNRDMRARLKALLATTPWRLTAYNDGRGIEQHFVFATAAQAAAFAAHLNARAAVTNHHPELSGCGRHVHVLLTTYTEQKGLTQNDVTGAEEIQNLVDSGLVGEVAGEVAAAAAAPHQHKHQQQHPLREVLAEREDAVRELFLPEYKRLGRKGQMTTEEWASGHEGLWEWLKDRVWVENGGVWPAWGIMFGVACITQARFVENEGGNLVLAAKEHWPNTDDEDMKNITNKTTLRTGQRRISGKVPVMEEMLKQGVLGW
ncbi:hypothetical protein SLS58_010453 [Diplodia intermedia]|uniref:4a-hydroxytetrahydrobiopterin dehydratase n=1 Tax=Diplodia intermedia TaxID=856260 RepID=A0ABR3T6L0_9PEZI